MTKHAEGVLRVASWDENTYEEFDGGAKLTRSRVTQVFNGDLEATGIWEVLMCYRKDGTASSIGFERVVGRFGDRSGSFVLQTNGGFDGTGSENTWSVVPGSGTDYLRSLRGQGTFVASRSTGTFTLDYELD
jgi:Protein of unknown function (DUF3224)